ncbi:ankyrin [Ceratobasidium sp. AG-I]|nr:ankyrin [Ceratobasidium sp. AG-I]
MSSSGSPTFQSAVEYINHIPASTNISTTIQLQLYAAYKCVTAGVRPTASRPSFFDMSGRAKWDAWDSFSKTLEDEVDPVQAAEERYIQQARNLGWHEGQEIPSNSQEGERRSGGGGGGMGTSVSVPVGNDTASVEDSVHGFAISGNIGGLEALLDEQPALVNARDEFEYTPLHLAADRGHLDVIRLLLSRGADTTLKDQDGDTGLEIAAVAKHEAIVQMLREHQNGSS